MDPCEESSGTAEKPGKDSPLDSELVYVGAQRPGRIRILVHPRRLRVCSSKDR